MTHPWDDLMEEELTKMVDFCREYFCDHDKLRPIGMKGTSVQSGWRCCTCHKQFTMEEEVRARNEQAIQWKWKKGDWAFDEEDGTIHPCVGYNSTGDKIGFHSPVERRVMYYANMDGAVPLPLAHQWEEQKMWKDTYHVGQIRESGEITYYIVELNTGTGACFIPAAQHHNPHYTRYLGFKKVIENA